MRKRLRCGLLMCLSALLVVSSVSAISESQLDMFAENGIMFYDPTGNDACYGGFSNICGTTAAEKVFSGLISVGFTPEQAAGALGNIAHEGNMNPAQWEIPYEPSFDYYNDTGGVNGSGGGVGLIQWSGGRRVNILKHIQEVAPNLMKYLHEWQTYSDGYKIDGDKFIELAGEQDANALYSVEIKYLYDEMSNNNSYKKVFDTTTVEDATWMFLTQVERPRGITVNTSLEDAKRIKSERFETAQKYWDELQNFSCGSSSSGGSGIGATDGANVTIIGDSLTVGSSPNLLELMPNADIDGEVGRQFATGIEIAGTKELRDVVVFALGTNSVGLTTDQINQALTTIGGDKAVILVTNYGAPSSGMDYTSNNQAISDAAAANANVKIADWAASAGANPDEYISNDGIHPTAAGNKLFADLIYNVISGMGGVGDGCGPGGDFAQLVLAYAWPEYHASPYLEMMPDYKDVVAKRQSEKKYVGGGNNPGIDCGGWVTTIMQESGYESEYNNRSEATGGQENWVQTNGWTRLNPSGEDVDTSLLQQGDVAFTDGHTFVFVGEIAGFDSVIASASFGGWESSTTGSWRTPMAGKESLTGGVRWYRKGGI